jgi:hypothetical protein
VLGWLELGGVGVCVVGGGVARAHAAATIFWIISVLCACVIRPLSAAWHAVSI